MAEPFDDLIETTSCGLSRPTGDGIVIDIGTGDGLFVYQSARENPKKFYIGIDANPRPLEKISEKIHRAPAKDGLANVLFLQSAIDDLPSELSGIADEIHIHFPWGSLLRVLATGDVSVLCHLRRLCASDAVLEIMIALDPERDRSEIERLGLAALSADYIDRELTPRYQTAGFEIVEKGVVPRSQWLKLQTSWAKRLRDGKDRTLVCIIARSTDEL